MQTYMNFCWRSEALSLLMTELLEECIVYNRDWVLPQISGGSSQLGRSI